MNAQPLMQFGAQDSSRSASRALDDAVQALNRAERDGTNASEIIRLCDEVIARRLRLQALALRSSGSTPPNVVAQMSRDRQLLEQASVFDD
jgi:hypothetical protein